jgi:hypothetical protein
MLQIETIENLTGFGSSNASGEFYHSENLIPGQFGLEASISVVDDAVTDSPARFNWFAEGFAPADTAGLWAVDTAGKLFKKVSGTWALQNDPGAGSSGNGLIFRGDGFLFYARDRYLGTYNGATWSDTAFDFGSANTTTEFRPAEIFEDWVLFGNSRKIAMYNISDSSFTNAGFTLPNGYLIRAIKANQTGILIGANFNNKGVMMLWDAQALRSISAWVWFESPILSICKYGARWIVTTTKQQFITDGYSLTPLPLPPDVVAQSDVFNCIPAGTKLIGDKLYTANTSSLFNRLKSGVYIQDLNTGQFSFATVDNNCKTDMTMGAFYKDSVSALYTSYTTNLPSAHHVAQINDQISDFVTVISPRVGAGTNNKIAEGVKLDISANPRFSALNSSAGYTVALKIYNFKRQLWGYGVTNAASTSANQLKIDGTATGYNNAQIGDEITMLSGANAGLVRHITSISGAGTSSEVWTLDSNLTGNTENGAYFNVQPFQLVKTKVISISNLSEMESIYFDIRNQIKGRKFLIKAVITGISGVSISVPSLTFIYDDVGVI